MLYVGSAGESLDRDKSSEKELDRNLGRYTSEVPAPETVPPPWRIHLRRNSGSAEMAGPTPVPWLVQCRSSKSSSSRPGKAS